MSEADNTEREEDDEDYEDFKNIPFDPKIIAEQLNTQLERIRDLKIHYDPATIFLDKEFRENGWCIFLRSRKKDVDLLLYLLPEQRRIFIELRETIELRRDQPNPVIRALAEAGWESHRPIISGHLAKIKTVKGLKSEDGGIVHFESSSQLVSVDSDG